jgi:hypothetical protein
MRQRKADDMGNEQEQEPGLGDRMKHGARKVLDAMTMDNENDGRNADQATSVDRAGDGDASRVDGPAADDEPGHAT